MITYPEHSRLCNRADCAQCHELREAAASLPVIDVMPVHPALRSLVVLMDDIMRRHPLHMEQLADLLTAILYECGGEKAEVPAEIVVTFDDGASFDVRLSDLDGSDVEPHTWTTRTATKNGAPRGRRR